jgi:membrane-bound acyltransferase YfiQ involved in biofilm formation
MIWKWRWMFLTAAVGLYVSRLTYFQTQFAPNYLTAIESNCWILSVFAFGYKYLNRSSNSLTYLSEAAYPVYILHMIFLYLGSLLIFPMDIPVQLEFVLVLAFTLAGCFGTYELVRRVNIIRPLFGLKMKTATSALPSVSASQ